MPCQWFGGRNNVQRSGFRTTDQTCVRKCRTLNPEPSSLIPPNRGSRTSGGKTEPLVGQVVDQRPAGLPAIEVLAEEVRHIVDPPSALPGHVRRDDHVG